MKTFLIITFAILGFCLTIMFIVRNVNRLVLKGHERVKVGCIVSIFFILFFILFFFLYFGSSAIIIEKIGFLPGFLNIIIIPILTSAFISYIGRNVPPREIKQYGKRKVSKTNKFILIFAISLTILCIAFLLAILFLPNKYHGEFRWYDLFRFGIIFSMLGYIIDYYNKKRLLDEQISEEEFRVKSFSVLYLRSFYLDELPFDTVEKKINLFGNLSKFESYAHGGIKEKSYKLSFTEYFGHCITSFLGEFICIGNPSDTEIREGAKVFYPKPELWKNYFTDYLRNARLIFMRIGDSKYIEFEIKAVKSENKLNSLFLFTKPNTPRIIKYPILKKYIDWLNDAKELDWIEIKDKLEANNITVTIPHAPGMVFTFDNNSNTVLVAKNCTNPMQYISAIRKYCQTHNIRY